VKKVAMSDNYKKAIAKFEAAALPAKHSDRKAAKDELVAGEGPGSKSHCQRSQSRTRGGLEEDR